MKIRTTEDNTGIAPRDSLWSAVDDDTYDGAEDSHCPIGWGATEAEAVADLMEQLNPLPDVTDSVAIRRLIEEVRLEQGANIPHRYNRVYSRHNRS